MKKNYFYITFLFLLFSLGVSAQESKDTVLSSKNQDKPFYDLDIYPNPVSNGRVFITSKSNDEKDIRIFNVIGKLVIQASLTTKELNVSSLPPGVYIIKITEGEQRATRKLIIK
jgi:Secretion system C-terminal sorting domain